MRQIAALMVLAAPLLGFGPPAAQAAQLEVGDLLVHYATQTDTTATGTIAFNIRGPRRLRSRLDPSDAGPTRAWRQRVILAK